MDTPTERNRLQAGWVAALEAGIAVGLCLTGCGRGASSTNAIGEAAPNAAGYGPAPELVAVADAKAGKVRLSGSSPAAVSIRLATPSGPIGFATSDDKGRWVLDIAAAREPRLLSLSMAQGGRIVQAMGYLFVAPDGAAARLRAGGGSELIAGDAPQLAAQTVDYDNQGAATLAGRAAPGETVRVRVDGVERGQGSADERGKFVVPLNQPLSPGSHDVDLMGASAEVETPVVISSPAALSGTPFVASRIVGGWRIDWLTPGGGEQTTLLLGSPGPRS